MRPSPNGFWLSVCIAKVIGIFYHRVASMPRLAFEGLELCDGKLSRTVLRGLGAGNNPQLPGVQPDREGPACEETQEGPGIGQERGKCEGQRSLREVNPEVFRLIRQLRGQRVNNRKRTYREGHRRISQ